MDHAVDDYLTAERVGIAALKLCCLVPSFRPSARFVLTKTDSPIPMSLGRWAARPVGRSAARPAQRPFHRGGRF